MNIITNLQARIENRLTETKNPCKLYATENRAEAAIAKLAAQVGKYFGSDRPAQFVVFQIESVGKWTAAIDINEVCSRPESRGGFVGICADKGFYTY